MTGMLSQNSMQVLEVIALILPSILVLLLFYRYQQFSKESARLRRENSVLQNDLGETLMRQSRHSGQNQNSSEVMDSLPFPAWIRNENLRLIYGNKKFYSAMGIDTKTMMHSLDHELFSGSQRFSERVILRNHLQRTRSHIIIEGKRIWHEIIEIPTHREDGTVSGTIGFAMDRSDIEQKEKELQHHRASQSNLLESSASAIAIFGNERSLQFFNDAFVRLWKLDRRWLEQHPQFTEIIDELREHRSLPEQADFKAYKEKANNLFTDLLERKEKTLYLPDGRTIRVVIIPHDDSGLLISADDITEIVTLEQSYNTLISVKKSTLDNLEEAVAVFGQNGRLQLCNPSYAEMWQLDYKWLVSSEPHIREIMEAMEPLYPEDKWLNIASEIKEAMNVTSTDEKRLYLSDGSIVNWSSLALPDGDILMTYNDITDSIRIEESLRKEKQVLEEVDVMKTRFLENVSYELRSPLTSIKGFSELLMNQYAGDLNDKQSDYLRHIYDSSIRLNTLIDNILDVASIDAGQMDLQPERFDIKPVLERVSEGARNMVSSGKARIAIKCPDDIGTMLGDKKRIKQVIRGLLHNTIYLSSGPGNVTLSANGDDEWIEIKIRDNNANAAERAPSGNDSVSAYRSDSGLGIHIAKSFIEMHGGTIEIDADENGGAMVICRMPRSSENLISHEATLPLL